MAKQIIFKTPIKREANLIYYCCTSEDGYVTIGCSPMARGRKKKNG